LLFLIVDVYKKIFALGKVSFVLFSECKDNVKSTDVQYLKIGFPSNTYK